MKKKIIAAIPARFDSQRFHGKMLADLVGLPLICQTYKSALKTQLFNEVIVITDSDEIEQAVKAINGKVLRSQKKHECGSDRIAEAIEKIKVDLIINIQGDEPFIDKKSLQKLIKCFDNKSVDLATLKQKITLKTQIENPNIVKIICDQNNDAMYFSRTPLPYVENTKAKPLFYKHIGIYAFTKKTLLKFYHSPLTPLEKSEQIEAIRFLEMGCKMKVLETEFVGLGIDTPADLKKARQLWK